MHEAEKKQRTMMSALKDKETCKSKKQKNNACLKLSKIYTRLRKTTKVRKRQKPGFMLENKKNTAAMNSKTSYEKKSMLDSQKSW